MTADVIPDRRVTVPILGLHTAFVDGSRLSWALPSPVHERLGYRVLVPDRIQGDAVLPHSSFTAQSRITSRRSCANRPDPPASRRARHRQGMVWSRWSLRQIAERRPALTMAARGAPAGIKVGTKKPARSNKETDASANSCSLQSLPLDSQPHTRMGERCDTHRAINVWICLQEQLHAQFDLQGSLFIVK